MRIRIHDAGSLLIRIFTNSVAKHQYSLAGAAAHGYDYYNQDPLTYVEEMAENLPVVSNKRMTPFQVNPQVSELLNRFEKNIDALDLLGEADSEADTKTDITAVNGDDKSAVRNSGVPRTKRPPPMLIPIDAVRKFSEHGLDSLNLTECLVGTPTAAESKDKVVVIAVSPVSDSWPEETVPITPIVTVNQIEELTDEIVEELPPEDEEEEDEAPLAIAEEEEPDSLPEEAAPSPPPPPAEKENKKRKVEPAPKVERLKRKRTTMSVKKEED